MYSSPQQITQFFSSSVWSDIKGILESDIHNGYAEILNPDVNQIEIINHIRGKLEILSEMLNMEDKLNELREFEVSMSDNGHNQEELL